METNNPLDTGLFYDGKPARVHRSVGQTKVTFYPQYWEMKGCYFWKPIILQEALVGFDTREEAEAWLRLRARWGTPVKGDKC